MYICFLSSMHPPYDKRIFDKEAISLVSAGHRIIHVCPGDYKEKGEFKGVEVFTYSQPSGIKGRLLQLFKLYKIASSIEADAYHCNEVDSWLVGVILKITKKKICIFDVHEHYPSTFAESRFPKILNSLVSKSILFLYRLLLPFTDRIVLAKSTISGDFPCEEQKKILVRNFTPISGLKFAGKRDLSNFQSEICFVHFGLFGKKRGWPQLLEAFRLMKYRNYKLLVIGQFNDDSFSEFESKVFEYDLKDRVFIYEWMPFDEAFKYLSSAHVGLVVFQPGILNHVYAMPHKMFDYMAAGCAVVCPEFAVEVAPIVEESGCGLLVNSGDPVDIAQKLDVLVSSPSLIHEMGLRGQVAVQKKYNWELEAQRLLAMYKELDN